MGGIGGEASCCAIVKGETVDQKPPPAAASTAEQEKLNRQALLAIAKDLKGVVEAHEAYNTSARLRKLYQAHEMAGQNGQ